MKLANDLDPTVKSSHSLFSRTVSSKIQEHQAYSPMAAFVPPSSEYSFYDHDMSFYVTFTLHEGEVLQCRSDQVCQYGLRVHPRKAR
jgi:hypothetical protein